MNGIAIGRSPTSNILLLYNPRKTQFYEPESYRPDSYHIPGSMYSNIKYDGGFFCSLVIDGAPSQDEAYPLGTRVTQEDQTTHTICKGTVMDIPLDPSQPVEHQAYLTTREDLSATTTKYDTN